MDWVWWKHGVIYHIYPRSFYDANHDGIGDLQGILEKLDYLQEMGVSAIWLCPIYQTNHVDFGYDVSHYRKIDPVFGTLEDFKKLLSEAQQRNIKVIMDLVLNHTSNQHDWFTESRSSIHSPKRDWYIWKKGIGKKPPNNWKSLFGGRGWTYDPITDQHYFHSFLPEQPDLNWRNSELKAILFSDIKYWLDMGVDGFRLDVINLIGKDKKLRNNPNIFQRIFQKQKHYSRNRKKSLKITKELRALIDSYESPKVIIGEIFAPPPGNSKLAATYIGKMDDNLNMTFDFSLIFSRWNARKYYQSIKKWYNKIPASGWPCNVLSNHDLLRSYNRFRFRTHKLAKAKLEALLLLSIKGTPFIYYGEEIGQANYWLKRKKLKDPLGIKFWPLFSGRDPARTPMQWEGNQKGGFSTVEPWLPVNVENAIKQQANVQDQQKDKYSLLNLYKRLITLRTRHKALYNGEWIPYEKGTNGVLSYLRKDGEEELLIALNFKSGLRNFKLPNDGTYELIFSINNPQNTDVTYSENFKLEPFAGVIFQKKVI